MGEDFDYTCDGLIGTFYIVPQNLLFKVNKASKIVFFVGGQVPNPISTSGHWSNS